MTRKGKPAEVLHKSRLLISHVDLDGHGGILLGKLLSSQKPELAYDGYMSVNYGFEEEEELWKEILTFDIVHICDISVPEDKYVELRNNCEEVLLFDHHDSSKELDKFEEVNHDQERCGTRIYFEDYYRKQFSRTSKILKHFVTLVDTYDRWQKESELWDEAVNLNSVLFGFMNWNEPDGLKAAEIFYTKYMIKLTRLKEWRWLDRELELIERSKKKVEQAHHDAIMNLSIRMDYKGQVFGVTSIGSKISLVCSKILEEYPEFQYLIVVNSYNIREGKLSIRSTDPDFDCTKIYPFNGHLSAAGGEIKEEEAREFLNDEMLCFPYKVDQEETKTTFETCIIS